MLRELKSNAKPCMSNTISKASAIISIALNLSGTNKAASAAFFHRDLKVLRKILAFWAITFSVSNILSSRGYKQYVR